MIAENSDVGIDEPGNVRWDTAFFVRFSGWGINCGNGSCARIERNRISGLPAGPADSRVYRTSYGVELRAGDTLVDSNRILGGSSGFAQYLTYGLVARGSTATVTNNRFEGGGTHAVWLDAGAIDLHSNHLLMSSALRITSNDKVRNNVIESTGGVLVHGAGTASFVFQHNAMKGPSNAILFSGTVDGASVEARSISELETLLGPGALGNLALGCARSADFHLLPGSACIDAGTREGAPLRDMDGQLRDALPDIGPDEYVP